MTNNLKKNCDSTKFHFNNDTDNGFNIDNQLFCHDDKSIHSSIENYQTSSLRGLDGSQKDININHDCEHQNVIYSDESDTLSLNDFSDDDNCFVKFFNFCNCIGNKKK